MSRFPEPMCVIYEELNMAPIKNKTDIDLEDCFAKYYKMLYKTSAIMLCNEHDASDAVQETFVKYLERKKPFTDEEHKKAWLLRVNINICKNLLRFRGMHPTMEYDKVSLHYDSDDDKGLMEALFNLKKKSKEILILRYIEGYTNAEIAKILGISENAAKKRAERARKELEKEYIENGGK